MADTDRLLELMHPMREPPQPAAVTPFLFMVGVGCLAALAAFVLYWIALRRRAGLRRSAEAALAASRALAPPDRLAAQAMVLRRLVRSTVGDRDARAQGSVWLQTLDRLFATHFFTQGEGQAFGDALYARSIAVDVDALDRALGRLIATFSPPRTTHV